MIATNLILEKNLKMEIIISTYRTFSGIKKIAELPRRKASQYIIYQDNKPKYYVDLYDLSIESNAMMNSLVLCAKKSMREVLDKISKRNNVRLSIPIISKLGISRRLKSERAKINLEPLPEEWLDYSL